MVWSSQRSSLHGVVIVIMMSSLWCGHHGYDVIATWCGHHDYDVITAWCGHHDYDVITVNIIIMCRSKYSSGLRSNSPQLMSFPNDVITACTLTLTLTHTHTHTHIHTHTHTHTHTHIHTHTYTHTHSHTLTHTCLLYTSPSPRD